MKYTICLAVLLNIVSADASLAETLYEQALPSWNSGWCAPCSGIDGHDYRTFASFSLAIDSRVTGATFAIYDESGPDTQDIQVSVWDAPFGTELFSAELPGGTYTIIPITPYTQTSIVELPSWKLNAGSYYLSLLGQNGNWLGWGTNNANGDDLQFDRGSLIRNDLYVGLTITGLTVPEPGALLLLMTAGLGFLAIRRR